METAVVAGASLLASHSQSRASERATKAQVAAQREAIAAQQQAAEQARAQAIPLYQSSQQNQLMGIQGALNLLGQTIPQQMQASMGGNLNAQQTLRAGLDPSIAAILGGNVNLGGIQPQQLTQPDFSMFQQQLPQFETISQALMTNSPYRPQRPQQGSPTGRENFDRAIRDRFGRYLP